MGLSCFSNQSIAGSEKRKQQWKVLAVLGLSLLLLIGGILAYKYVTTPPSLTEKIAILRKEKHGEEAYSLLTKMVFLDDCRFA